MHAGTIHPAKKRFACLHLSFYPFHAGACSFIIHSFHSFNGQRAGIFYFTIGCGMKYATWPVHFSKCRVVFWPCVMLRFLLGIQVVQVTIKFVKAMFGG